MQSVNPNSNDGTAPCLLGRSDDGGTPTASLCADLRRSLALIHEERHLVAYDLYRDVLRRLDAATATAPARRRAPFHAFHSPLRRRRQQQQQGTSPAATSAVAAGAGVPTGDRDGSGMDRMQDIRNAKVLLERKEEEFTTLEVSGAANIHHDMTTWITQTRLLGLYAMCASTCILISISFICNVPRNEPTYSSAPSGI